MSPSNCSIEFSIYGARWFILPVGNVVVLQLELSTKRIEPERRDCLGTGRNAVKLEPREPQVYLNDLHSTNM